MLEVLVLGTAAGGGFPQWNCACANCGLARSGVLPSRLQSSLAVSGNGRDWHLVNSSPDVTRQLERFIRPRLGPDAADRSAPIRSVFLTNADLDHSLGLFHLREGGPIRVTAPTGARESLDRGLGLGAVLGAYGGIEWQTAEPRWRTVDASGLEVCAVPLEGGGAPRYDPTGSAANQAVGYLFRAGGGVAGVFPDVAQIDGPLLEAVAASERVWFDGTFWSEDEMMPLTGRAAAAMGHVPIGGPGGSLATWSRPDRVAYLHLNNTNPVLRPDSSERAALTAVGARIAEDGDHFVV